MGALVVTKKPSPSYMPLFNWFLQVLVVPIFFADVIFLCLTTTPPIYSVTNLYISNVTFQDHVKINHKNTTLVFTLMITNPNKAKPILYNATKITTYNNGSIYGDGSLPEFYQDGLTNISRQVLVQCKQQGGLSKNDIVKVGVETSVRFNILGWTTKKHLLSLEAYFPVDMNGRFLLRPEGVELKPVKKFEVQKYKFYVGN